MVLVLNNSNYSSNYKESLSEHGDWLGSVGYETALHHLCRIERAFRLRARPYSGSPRELTTLFEQQLCKHGGLMQAESLTVIG